MEDKIKFENDSMAIELVKILSLPSNASWAEIFIEIGRLQERAGKNKWEPNPIINEPYRANPDPYFGKSITHYHNGIMCTENPCVWS